MCEFSLSPAGNVEWYSDSRGALELTITGLRLFDQEDVEGVRMCCPLPCEDLAWDRRWVAKRWGSHS